MPDPPAWLAVRVQPRAVHERVGPLLDGVLQVRVSRPPAGGEANEAVRRLLSEALAVPVSRVELVTGNRGRQKRFAIHGLSPEELAARLRRLERAD